MENQFKKADTFLDGFIHYGQIQTLRNSKGVKTGETFNELGKLAFSEVNIRDTDNVTAFSLGYTINKKIKVPYRKIESNIKAGASIKYAVVCPRYLYLLWRFLLTT